MKRVLVSLLSLAVAFVAITAWALEAGGVAIVTTRTADGHERRTHVWFVEEDGVVWLEAGTPENPWYVDLARSPELALARSGAAPARHRAHAVPERSARVRAQLRAKYGWRDRWVGLFVDSSRSLAVRLEPAVP
jgi:hypothetical protein